MGLVSITNGLIERVNIDKYWSHWLETRVYQNLKTTLFNRGDETISVKELSNIWLLDSFFFYKIPDHLVKEGDHIGKIYCWLCLFLL